VKRASVPFTSLARTVLTVIVLAAAITITTGAALLSAPAGAVPGPVIRTDSTTAPGIETWGDNSAGELGDATLEQSLVPVPAITAAAGVNTITSVSAGGRHDLALLSNGTVLAWGDDTFGQLGNGSASADDNAEKPALVENLSGVVAVSAGDEHSLALLGNGTVMSWGDNDAGQLGNGTKTDSDVPVLVEGLTGVTAISAGSQFNLAVLSDGSVESWGNNNAGQLGDNSFKNSDIPIVVKGLTGVTDVAAGGFHSLALLSKGTVMSWGDNTFDQLGDGQDTSTQTDSPVPVAVVELKGVVAIAAGQQHSLALTKSGTVEAWGDNGFFQLAQPQGFPNGFADSDVPLVVPGVGGSTAIAAGGLYSLALSTKGTVFAWGDNAFGQLGNSSTKTRQSVVEVKGLKEVTAIAASGAQSLALVGAPAPDQSNLAGASQKKSPWQVVPTAADTDHIGLTSVSASSPHDAWAVGSSNASETGAEPAAEHWAGMSWTVATLPAIATPSTLTGVDDLSPTDAWAVGETGSTGSERTLIEHWDGTSWTVVTSPDPGTGPGEFDELQGVSGTNPDDLWAVGTFTISEDGETLAAPLLVNWNGATWNFFEPPSGSASSNEFGEAVTVVSADDVWAVGDDLGGTVSAHFNGKKWSNVNTPILQGKGSVNELTGVTNAGADDIWASGFGVVDNFRTPYLLHWTGTAWTLVKVPNAGSEGSQLTGVTAISARDVWVTGATDETDGGILAFSGHYNGSSWSIVPTLDPGQLASLSSNVFQSIAAAGKSTLFAIGSQEMPGKIAGLPLAEEDATAG
jgi:alpha-tubulin suppressor-like RCC1 family protein